MLNNLAGNVNNAREMLVNYVELVPLLVEKMSGSTRLHATKVVYGLSCSPANRAILRGDYSVVAALARGREDENMATSLFSHLALVNVFGAEKGSKVLTTDLAMLQRIFNLIARAMSKNLWGLNSPLLAFRYLCAVKGNRELLWDEYGSEFLSSVFAALQQAIDEKDIPAAENAVFTWVQFSYDTKPLAWMRSNKAQLDEVIARLAPFPKALKAAQFLLLTIDPPKVFPKRGLSDDSPAKRQQVAFSKSRIPQNEQEIREWLSKHKHGEEIADRLAKEGLVDVEDLKRLSEMKPAKLKGFLNLNCKQTLTLEEALKEIF